MPGKRSYDDGCATAHALDLLGERWALLVVRELMLGPKRFSDLRADLATISPNVLTQRLTELESAAIVRRLKLPPPAASWVYELTPWGQDLEPIIRDLGRWAARSPQLPQGRPMSTTSLVLAMRTMFDPHRAGIMRMRLLLHLGQVAFLATVGDHSLDIRVAGRLEDADVEVTSSCETLDNLLFGQLGLEAAEATGVVGIRGNRELFCSYLTLFPLPPPATI